jgi:uncharacterized protein (DUF885 family)
MDFITLRRDFFDAMCAAQPEDATTLGLRAFDPRLRDGGPDGVDDELSACRSLLIGLDEVEVPADRDAQRDADAMRRLARFRLRTVGDRREHLGNLELSLLPVAAVHHLLRMPRDVERDTALAARLELIPTYLRARERALLLGRDEGHTVAPEVRDMVAGWALPETGRELAALLEHDEPLREASQRAAAALADHAAFVTAHVATSGEGSRLGEEEVAWRIEGAWGLSTPPSEIAQQAEDALEEARATFLVRARAHDSSIRDRSDADRLLSTRFSEKLDASEVAPRYQRAIDRARAFAIERRLFDIPAGFAIEVLSLPRGLMAGGSATNFPAPLLGKGSPMLALSPDPAAHPPISITNLAIHEGVPGHGLDSYAFRASFGADPTPVRFLGVHDDLMIATHWLGPMLRIEGFAVYVEELLDREGFYEDDTEGAMFLAACQAIRAGRLLADLELHTTGASVDEVAARFSERVGMPLRWARMQAIRYLRVPLQAATYHLGGKLVRERVEALKAQHGSMALAHEALFAAGTSPPTLG